MSSYLTVAGVMTAFPYSIELGEDIVTARLMMDDHDIRHLPVTDNRQLVGLLAYSDIRAAGGAVDSGGTPEVLVRSVCSMPAYVVDSQQPLYDVVDEMAERQLSTAIVTRNGELVGILTTTDICRVLVRVLRSPASGQSGHCTEKRA